jgi:hypothetical protein
MQKWEYLYILRSRSSDEPKSGKNYGEPTAWENQICSSTEKREFTYTDLSDALKQLGEEGWELVAISPRSSYFGVAASGFTNHEIWVFKRPKE